MGALVIYIDGIGWYSPGAADWTEAARQLRGEAATDAAPGRPNPAVLTPNERRRAPEPVAIACDVAGQACAMAARGPASLACVFASAHGDLATTDALCTTLATEPLETSPIKFHNSVHNAPAGYWTIATHCHAASTAVAAWHGSFAAGLLEAATQACADEVSVLFACYDIAPRGPLVEVIDQPEPFGVAFVLGSERSERTCAQLRLRHEADAPEYVFPHPQSPMPATFRPLFTALAHSRPAHLRMRNGRASALAIEVAA